MIIAGADTETALIEPGIAAPALACLTWDYGDGPAIAGHLDAEAAWEAVLARADVLGIHNAPFDTCVVAANYPRQLPAIFEAYDEGRIVCTRVREQLRLIQAGDLNYREDDPDAEKQAKVRLDLASLVRIHLRRKLDKSEDTYRKRYAELIPIPVDQWPSAARVYAMTDATEHREVFLAQGEITPEDQRQSAYAFALKLMAVWGLRTDGERVAALEQALLADNAKLSEALIEANLMRPNPKNKSGWSKNLKLIRSFVSEAYRGNPPTTDKGNIKTDAETLAACTTHPYLAGLSKWDANGKILSTYVEPMKRGVDQPLCTEPNVLVASGRTSWRMCNLQNFPGLPGIRECFIPRPGSKFINADYDSLESRALGQVLLDLVGESTLARRYQDDPDYDPHTEFAGRLMGVDYPEALRLKAAKDETLLDYRKRAKVANFGYPGGMGAAKFVIYAKGYGLDIDLEESTHLRNAWFQQWPEMAAYFRIISNIANGSGRLKQLRSNRIRGRVGYTDGANSYFQGLAADGAKAAMWLIQKACYLDRASPLYGSRMQVFIHDEFLGEAPTDQALAAAAELARLMQVGMAKFIPDVPIRAAPIVMDRWYKSTKGLSLVNGVFTDA